ncbi:hypothetical protein J1N35_022576, partial [Gossypium stocksii]
VRPISIFDPGIGLFMNSISEVSFVLITYSVTSRNGILLKREGMQIPYFLSEPFVIF